MPDESVLKAFLPIFIRCLGALMFIPLNSESTSYFRNISVAALLAALLCVDLQLATEISFDSLVGEFCVGLILGLPAVLLIEGALILGELIDNGRGQNFAGMYDPLSGNHNSSIALLSHRFAAALLLVSGYFELLVSGIYSSVNFLPLCGLSSDKLQNVGERLIPLIAQVLSGAFGCYLIFATVYLSVDVMMAFLSKILTGAGLNGESFQLKSYLGFSIILLLIHFISGSTALSLARPALELLKDF